MSNNYINSINLKSNSDFPYLVLNVINDSSFPRNPGFQVMHWHEDLQFIYVLDGEIEVKTLEKNNFLKKGDGIFINQNVVHLVKKNGKCHYNSFIFPKYFLEFYIGSPAESYVDCVVESNIETLLFKTENGNAKKILQLLYELSELEKRKDKFYSYEVLCKLSCVLLEICKRFSHCYENHSDIGEKRMRKFLNFIENNYSQNITLAELAKSANVSKSECLRSFKSTMQTTPYKYLTEYRLSKAASLLKNSDEPIGNIATLVGIEQSSHFGKLFKEKTGMSPREYRKCYQNNLK